MLSVILLLSSLEVMALFFVPVLQRQSHQASSALPFSQRLPQLLIRHQVLWMLAFTISPIVIVFL